MNIVIVKNSIFIITYDEKLWALFQTTRVSYISILNLDANTRKQKLKEKREFEEHNTDNVKNTKRD